jgi:glucose/arabinose dehydrogenase
MEQPAPLASRFLARALMIGIISTASSALAQESLGVLQVPDGYQIEKVVDGLTYPTALTWDDQGNMYVAEAGGGFLEQLSASRIMRIEDGKAKEVVNLTDQTIHDPSSGQGVHNPVVGLVWHDGAFYFTHRDPNLTGAVSRVTMDGKIERLLSGFIDSQTEHQLDDIKLGPDGKMYLLAGPAGNAAVVGPDEKPYLMRSPDAHTTACEDIVLTGVNYKGENFQTEQEGDTVLTGAYVPFGTETTPGQVIKGRTKCGGAVLTFDPKDPEGTLDVYAWGTRNLIGIAWDDQGNAYAAENGYDVRGLRPVNDEYDATYRIQEGAWYGWPDFSAAKEPLNDPKFASPEEHMAEVFINGEPQGKVMGFLIDHEASGLTPPDPSLVVGLHPVNSSPSMLDVAPASWGDWAGHIFVAEWGDLAPPTNPLREEPVGSRIVRIDPEDGQKQVEPFIQNQQPGPASEQGAKGMGLERPFDVKFGPDGAMYIVDYGQVITDMERAEQGLTPHGPQAGTGIIWKVTRAQ